VNARSEYLERRRPHYRLSAQTVIDAPLGDVFSFFSRPENLGAITPPGMGFRITSGSGEMAENAAIAYRVRIGPAPVRWLTRIEAWEPNARFVDVQERGPYACWWHEHRFTADGPSRTVMDDTVLYAPPLGVLGRIANRVFIEASLRRIFAFRADAIRLRFGRGDGVRDELLAS
jgi:ligand-binding SRPBCC domain-containing protein